MEDELSGRRHRPNHPHPHPHHHHHRSCPRTAADVLCGVIWWLAAAVGVTTGALCSCCFCCCACCGLCRAVKNRHDDLLAASEAVSRDETGDGGSGFAEMGMRNAKKKKKNAVLVVDKPPKSSRRTAKEFAELKPRPPVFLVPVYDRRVFPVSPLRKHADFLEYDDGEDGFPPDERLPRAPEVHSKPKFATKPKPYSTAKEDEERNRRHSRSPEPRSLLELPIIVDKRRRDASRDSEASNTAFSVGEDDVFDVDVGACRDSSSSAQLVPSNKSPCPSSLDLSNVLSARDGDEEEEDGGDDDDFDDRVFADPRFRVQDLIDGSLSSSAPIVVSSSRGPGRREDREV